MAREHRSRRTTKRRIVRILGMLILFGLVGAAPIMAAQVGAFGRSHGVGGVEAHDVAIVFGAGVSPDKRPSAYLAARLDVAISLYEAGKVKVFLVSGSNPEASYNEPDAMIAYLVDHGIPADKIVADYAGNDTYATCMRASRIFGVSKAILVTQTYHLPRAVTTCRLVGIDVVGVGDKTVESQYRGLWQTYSFREIPGDYKMILDVVSRREPILGDPESSVTDALAK